MNYNMIYAMKRNSMISLLPQKINIGYESKIIRARWFNSGLTLASSTFGVLVVGILLSKHSCTRIGL